MGNLIRCRHCGGLHERIPERPGSDCFAHIKAENAKLKHEIAKQRDKTVWEKIINNISNKK